METFSIQDEGKKTKKKEEEEEEEEEAKEGCKLKLYIYIFFNFTNFIDILFIDNHLFTNLVWG